MNNFFLHTLFAFFLFFLSHRADAQKPWKQHIIDDASSGADGVKLADINNDGYMDMVVGWEEGGLSKLYINPGKTGVKEKWPAVVVGETPIVEDVVFADMNDDGKWDVVSCLEQGSKKIIVQLNQGKELLQSENWKQEILPASDGLMMWMYTEPLQLDNKNGVDLIAAGKKKGAAIGWFEAPENGKNLNDWQWHEILPVGWVMSIINRDMDKDGDIDVVISDRHGNLQGCRWLENPGLGKSQKRHWKNHFIGSINKEIMFMTMADTDGDGNEEAVTCERQTQTITIYKRLGSKGTRWEERSIKIPTSTGFAKSVDVGDIDGDGIKDLVLSTNTNNEKICGLMWLNGKISEHKESDWREVSEKHNTKYDKVELSDLDEVGDLDILICEENYGEASDGLGLVWYENPTIQ